MKRIAALLLAVIMLCTLFCGCKDKNKGDGTTLLFDYKKLSDYMMIYNYKGLHADTTAAEFSEELERYKHEDLEQAGLTSDTDAEDGIVADGDTVHITYVGTMDGVAFSGGSTGDEGTDLVIGSNSYIEGFESGLIGHKLNETVVLDLSFPNPYLNNPDYSGKPVQFTVNIQKISRKFYPEITDEAAVTLGYKDAEDYEEQIKKKCIRESLYNLVTENSKMFEYPEKELDYYVDADVKYYTGIAESNGTTFEDYLKAYDYTEKDFRTDLRSNYKQTMPQYLAIYYIAKSEKLTVTSKEIEAEYKRLADMNSMDVKDVKSKLDAEQVEFSLLYERVLDYIYDNAIIE